MVTQLIDEARLAMENKDRVSLSVIANRYTSEQDVARLVITDGKNDVLVPVGNAPMQKGDTIRQIATQGESVIGTVELTLKDVSTGEIIAMQWPFVVGSLILHLFLWLIYGYIARPTKEQINALSRDIHSYKLDMVPPADNKDAQAQEEGDIDGQQHTIVKRAALKSKTIHQELNAYLKSHQRTDKDAEETADAPVQPISAQPTKLSAAREFDSVSVNIMFHDEYNMLERLAPEMRMPYLALCTQLLNQAIDELLTQPILSGVQLQNRPSFDDKGACALLKADNRHAKVALAGVMLGKLYLMLNKIIHDKHIELSRFALPVKVGVSDEGQTDALERLLDSKGKKEQMLILLPTEGLKQIGHHVQVYSFKRPTSVYERECAVFDGANETLMQRLADARNAVLMSGNNEK
ncbi:hypothetical protein GCM10009129_12710 [Psychrobacter aestuarii]|uniref:Uncharacterized protein n=2 Tax=Psychrobacter aestuarii TaxID=556327 RepID=A0ABP3FFI7_9GAMM